MKIPCEKQGQAPPQRLDYLSMLRNLRMAPDKDYQGIVFPEILGEELANISAIEVGKPIELQTGDRTITEFHLDDGGARQVHMVCHVFLGHVTRFPRRPESPSEFVLTD